MLLAGKAYDPSTAASLATTAAAAMTALDTTNLRVTFTAPANGIVLVHIRTRASGASTFPAVLLGVLDGATVRGRAAPLVDSTVTGVARHATLDAAFLVTGLTPSSSYTWDAAAGVETGVASSAIRWGGPNNATANDAYGAAILEVWETKNLLAGKLYDPGTAVTSKAVSAALAMTALDTTNLRLTFTTAATGAGSTSVLVRIAAVVHGATTAPDLLFGVLDGATVRGRTAAAEGGRGNPAAVDMSFHEAVCLITGLTASTSYTWDAAYAVETLAASGNIKYGGPDDTTVDNAFGGLAFEVWSA